jgi:hypothetical protein
LAIVKHAKARFSSGRDATVAFPAAGPLLRQPKPVTAQNIKIKASFDGIVIACFRMLSVLQV